MRYESKCDLCVFKSTFCWVSDRILFRTASQLNEHQIIMLENEPKRKCKLTPEGSVILFLQKKNSRQIHHQTHKVH